MVLGALGQENTGFPRENVCFRRFGFEKLCFSQGKIIWDQSKPDGTFKKQLDVSKVNKLGWVSKISLNKVISELKKDLSKNGITAKNMKVKKK